MNGQMYQLCVLAAAGKKALKYNEPIQYVPAKYENEISFSCLRGACAAEAGMHTVSDVAAWFAYLKSMGLQDIKVLCPIAVKDKGLLGFSNTTESLILCFYKNGKVTYFAVDWQFDAGKKLWNVHYSEQEWKNPPSEKPRFENNADTFRQVLLKIKDFATELEFGNFARIFDSAGNILDGSEDYPDKKYGLCLPQIPQKNLQMFEAASAADVFGAMGSWNDSPPWAAHEKGLDQEYETLSDELLRNIRLAILYAINEW